MLSNAPRDPVPPQNVAQMPQLQALYAALVAASDMAPRFTCAQVSVLVWVAMHPNATASAVSKASGLANSGVSRVVSQALQDEVLIRQAIKDPKRESLFEYKLSTKGIQMIDKLLQSFTVLP